MANRLLRNIEADVKSRGRQAVQDMCKALHGFQVAAGSHARHKKSEICRTCSKLKHVCQVCLLDLDYGLPVQVRDTALNINSNDAIPRSDVNREYFAEEHDLRARAGMDYESSIGNLQPSDTIRKLRRTRPYYNRNRAHVCSFYVRGKCTRGLECPYRHEMPVTGELSKQNIKDRYYGVNDPVALKLLNKAGEMPSLEPPEDKNIRTLYVGGLDKRLSEQDLKVHFSAHGDVESIKTVMAKACAFVTFTTREGAEKAAEELANKLVVNGVRLKLLWGKPRVQKQESEVPDEAMHQAAVAHGGMLPRSVISQHQDQPQQPPGSHAQQLQAISYLNNIPPLPKHERVYYPSTDPQRMGALVSPHGFMPPPQQPCQQYPWCNSSTGLSSPQH